MDQTSSPALGSDSQATMEWMNATDAAGTSPQGNEIDECIVAMDAERNIRDEYPRIGWEDCDTAIMFDAPPRDPEHSPRLYSVICRYYDSVFPANSQILRKHSPTFFGPMFDERRQKRWMAKLHTKRCEPPSWMPKYAIDLTPSSEGEDAIQALMDLCCPIVVRIWHASRLRFSCPPEIVWGIGEFAKYTSRLNISTEPEDGRPDENLPVVSEYSHLRHYRAIERLLLLLHGKEVDFDSAVKVYTTAAISNHFRIVCGGPLQELVTTWVYHPQNKFIQIAPEVCIKIADWVEGATMARDAFAILVGEASQASACGKSQLARTQYGRRVGELDEMWQTRVQYARESFEQRILVCFESLTEENMHWLEALPEVQKLVSVREWLKAKKTNFSALETVEAQIKALKSLVRRCIHLCLCSEMIYAEIQDVSHNVQARELHPDTDIVDAWNGMRWKSRIFTSTFWRLLGSMNLHQLAGHGIHFRRQVTVGYPAELGFRTCTPAAIAAFKEAGVVPLNTAQPASEPVLATTLTTVHGSTPWSTFEEAGVLRRPLVEQNALSDHPFSNSTDVFGEFVETAWQTNSNPHFWRGVPVRSLSSTSHDLIEDDSDRDADYTEENAQRTEGRFQYALPFRPAFQFQVQPANIEKFYTEVEAALKGKASPMLKGPPDSSLNHKSVRLLDILICLDEDEIQCMPLWAGGCDDGTGGVFSAAVASSEERFAGGAEFTKGGEDDGFETMTITNSEVPTSLMVQDGSSEVMDRRQVYAISENDSEESFGIVDDTSIAETAVDREDDVQSMGSDTPTVTDATAVDDYTDIFMGDGDSSDDDDEF